MAQDTRLLHKAQADKHTACDNSEIRHPTMAYLSVLLIENDKRSMKHSPFGRLMSL